MLTTYGGPMSISAGLTGAGEVLYKLPKELSDCFSSKADYDQADGQWSQYLHKEQISEYVKDKMNEVMPADLDTDWKHYIPSAYQNYTTRAEKAMHAVYKSVHFSDQETQGYWDVLKESVGMNLTLY